MRGRIEKGRFGPLVWPDLTNGDGLRDKAKFLLDWDRKGGGSEAGEVGARYM